MAVKDVVENSTFRIWEATSSRMCRPTSAPPQLKAIQKSRPHRMRVRLSALNTYHDGHAATCDGINCGAAYPTSTAPAS